MEMELAEEESQEVAVLYFLCLSGSGIAFVITSAGCICKI